VSKILFGDFRKSSRSEVRLQASKPRVARFINNSRARSKEDLPHLAQRLLHVQENERRHLARELHDGLNQSMAMLEVEVGILLKQLPPAADAMRPQLSRLRLRVQRLSDDVRRISHQLHPAILDQLGLVAALNGLCAEFRAYHNIDVSFACDAPIEKLSFPVSVCLYRIAQEALCNAAKHANATEVVVSLTLADGEVTLSISDDGRGFDSLQPKYNSGLGLISMQERACVAGGRFFIDSHIGAGTRIKVTVPAQEAWQWKLLSETLLPVK
jgi:signal transduction histidine kinase